MTTAEIISTVAGSNIVTALIGFFMGRRKEDIEIALKYQEFYQKHINDLKNEIDALTGKVEILIDQDESKTRLIEEQRRTQLKWENYCEELKLIVKQKDKQIAKLFEEIEQHENNQ